MFQDLLSTNGYQTNRSISGTQQQKLMEERQQHVNYNPLLQQHSARTRQIRDRELSSQSNTQSNLNRSRSITSPFPNTGTQNSRPILSDAMQDITLTRYQKDIVSPVLMDSKRRDPLKNPYPNNYTLYLGREFNQVHKIVLSDLTMVNPNPPVNPENNSLVFKTPTLYDVFHTPLLFSLYPIEPTATRNQEYVQIYERVKDNLYFNDVVTSYDFTIAPGFYTTVDITDQITQQSRQYMFHPSMALIQNKIIPEHAPLQLICNIYPQTQEVIFTLRTEEIQLIAVQTLLEDTTNADPLKQFSNYSATPNPTFTQYGIPMCLIAIPIFYGTESQRSFFGTVDVPVTVQTTNFLPLFIDQVGIPDVGGISYKNIQNTLFFDHNLKEYLPLKSSTNVYAYYDTITMPTTNWTYQRYALYGHSQTTGVPLVPSKNEIDVFHKTLQTYFNSNWNTNNCIYLSITYGTEGGSFGGGAQTVEPVSRTIGRSFPIQFLESIPRTIVTPTGNVTQCKPTLLTILGWIFPEETYTVSREASYKFIHRNIDVLLETAFGLGVTLDPFHITREAIVYDYKQLPTNLLLLDKVGDFYYFRGEPYIFIKLLMGTDIQQPVGNERLIVANSNPNSFQYYVAPSAQNNIEAERGILTNSLDGMFAKILLLENAPNVLFIPGEIAEVSFYDTPIEKLNTLTIQFYSPSGKLLESRSEHSFTLEIHELQHILKDTHLDSKTGGVVTTGYYQTPL
jgi:hypothetical protein